mgnify:CR=1 FL=1
MQISLVKEAKTHNRTLFISPITYATGQKDSIVVFVPFVLMEVDTK